MAVCLLNARANSVAQDTFTLDGGYVGGADGTGSIPFTLIFNQAPDFFTVDPFGKPANEFQFYIATTPDVPDFYPPRPYASLIRGGEIHVSGLIPIRNDGPWDSTDPHSGGWGSIRGRVPYSLTGQTLTFSIPADVLNVQGPFAYSLLLVSYGTQTGSPYTGLSGGPIPVPEPSWFALAAIGVFGLGIMRMSSRRNAGQNSRKPGLPS